MFSCFYVLLLLLVDEKLYSIVRHGTRSAASHDGERASVAHWCLVWRRSRQEPLPAGIHSVTLADPIIPTITISSQLLPSAHWWNGVVQRFAERLAQLNPYVQVADANVSELSTDAICL
jgi:hypothetical protein